MDSREVSKIATHVSERLSAMGAGFVSIDIDGTVHLDGVFTIEELQKVLGETARIQALVSQR